MGDQAIDIYNNFQYADREDAKSFTVVVSKFDEFCKPRKNVVFDRFKFFSRSQEVGEPIDRYVTELKKLAAPCEFAEQELENLIRDRLVLGLIDKNVQERLLRESDLKLKKALDYCRANEVSKQQVEEIKGACSVSDVKSTSKIKWTRKKNCMRCGYNHKYKQCPAAGKICGKCGKNKWV